MTSAHIAEAHEVDAAFLDQVLGGPRGRVVAAEVTPIGTGQVATTLRARLQWSVDDPSLPGRVVVKVAATNDTSRAIAKTLDSYRREVEFYRTLAGRIDAITADCLHAAHDDATDSFTLVLVEAAGTVGDQIVGCTPQEAEAIVDAAAHLHAPLWGRSEELRPLDWLSASDSDAFRRREDLYRALLPGFLDRYRERLSTEVLDMARWLDPHLVAANEQRRCPECLVHNDLRIDNMIFRSVDGHVSATVVDWQTVGAGSGPADFAYSMGASLPAEARRPHEERWFQRYVDALAAWHVQVNRTDARHDYRLGTVDGLMMAVVASQVVVRTERGDEMFAVMAERHAQHMLDQRVHELVEH